MSRDRESRPGRRAGKRSPRDGETAPGEVRHDLDVRVPPPNERRDRAREAGEAALQSLRRSLERTAAELIRSDPDDAATALEMGLVDRKWLEQPGEGPISTTTPVGVLERFLERTVERRPSRLSALGLSALQVLCAPGGDGAAGSLQEVAVVFTDLVGFTAFTDTNGDEAALELLEEHYRRAGSVVRSFSGRVVKHLGDGLLCTFPDAESGLRAALEMLDVAPEPLRLRAGMHVGRAIVSRQDVVGQVVNVAARVAETANGGEVVVTEEAAVAAGEIAAASFGKARSRRLKGISDPISVRVVTKNA